MGGFYMGTNDYYKENAKSFILDTMNADMSEQYQNFLTVTTPPQFTLETKLLKQ